MTKQEQEFKKQQLYFEKQKRDQKKQQEEYVEEQELSARSWKARWEKMYYMIEAEKLEPEYKQVQENLKNKLREQEENMSSTYPEDEKVTTNDMELEEAQ